MKTMKKNVYVNYEKLMSTNDISKKTATIKFSSELSELENRFFVETGLKTTDKLMKLKKESLEDIAKELSVPHSGKNKRELVHSIKEECENVLLKCNQFNKAYNETDKQSICEYIAKTNTHVIVTKSIIKSIAMSGIDENGKVKNDCYTSCMKMYSNHFDTSKEPIFEDLCNDIYIELHNLVFSGECTIENGFIKLGTYETVNKDGEKKIVSSWIKLYKALRVGLSQYKNTNSQLAVSGNYIVGYDDENNEYIVSEKSNNYRLELAKIADNDKTIARNDLQSFFKVLKKEYPKQCEKMTDVVCCLIDGLTQEETAKELSVSVRTIQRYIKSIRIAFDMYGKLRTDSKNTSSATYTTTTCNGYGDSSNSYSFSYSGGTGLTGYRPEIKPEFVETGKYVVVNGKKKKQVVYKNECLTYHSKTEFIASKNQTETDDFREWIEKMPPEFQKIWKCWL